MRCLGQKSRIYHIIYAWVDGVMGGWRSGEVEQNAKDNFSSIGGLDALLQLSITQQMRPDTPQATLEI
eukprot:11068389-Karenia_brevis.AAC.1